jgi:drug/metabolite transporter (DMT)-like permease
VSLILANLFLGEAFTADLLVGATLIIGGVGAAGWSGRRA